MGVFMVKYRSSNRIKSDGALERHRHPFSTYVRGVDTMPDHTPNLTQPQLPFEEWRSVAGYKGIYEVSSFGRVRSLDRLDAAGNPRRGRVLSPSTSSGYLGVHLHRDRTGKYVRIHTLVAAAFVGDCPRGFTVNHIDSDKLNNHAANLEYLTMGDNIRHSMKLRRRSVFGPPKPKPKGNPKATQRQYTDDELTFIRGRLMGL